jgi:hypothetical protein
VIGGIVGAVASLLFFLGLSWLWYRQRRANSKKQTMYEKPQLHSNCLPKNEATELQSDAASVKEMGTGKEGMLEKPANEPPAYELAG